MMVVALCSVAASSTAFADNGEGASFDFGYVRSRIAVTDSTALDGDLGRFGIRIAKGRHFHFGAEVETGRLVGSTRRPDGTVARQSGEPSGQSGGGESLASPLDGNSLSLKSYAGLHARTERMMFGGDATLGFRDTWVSSDAGIDVAGYKKEPLIELRARAEFFLSGAVALGAVASTDLLDRRNVSLAAVFSLNFMR